MAATVKRNRAPQRYEPDLDHIEAAADFLAVNPRTVRRMMHAGKLRTYRVGNRGLVRVDMHEVRGLAISVPPESVSA
jgi:excisionase family DNA binding protein